MFLFLNQNPLDKLSSFFAGSFGIFYLTEIKSHFGFNHTNNLKHVFKHGNLYGLVSSQMSSTGTQAVIFNTAMGIQLYEALCFFPVSGYVIEIVCGELSYFIYYGSIN